MMDCSWCGDEMKENMLHICIEPEEAENEQRVVDTPIRLSEGKCRLRSNSLIVYFHEDCPNKNCP